MKRRFIRHRVIGIERVRRHPSAAALLPNLITIGNGVCGFAAILLLARVAFTDDSAAHVLILKEAAWLILLGMVFDVFDGRVARMTGRTSELGAQLDSLCDLVTFGLAPASLLITLYRLPFVPLAQKGFVGKVIWIVGLAYFLGAMLRLARFNVEHDAAEKSHQSFRGMPSPAAAGTVASLVLMYFWLKEWKQPELLLLADVAPAWSGQVARVLVASLPFVTFLLGFAMVTKRFSYPHVASQLLARRSFDTLVYLIFGGILTAAVPEPILCLGFLSYMCWAPVRALVRSLFFRGARGDAPSGIVPAHPAARQEPQPDERKDEGVVPP